MVAIGGLDNDVESAFDLSLQALGPHLVFSFVAKYSLYNLQIVSCAVERYVVCSECEFF